MQRALAEQRLGRDRVGRVPNLASRAVFPADLDQDSDVDLSDFTILESCLKGPNRAAVSVRVANPGIPRT